MKKSCLLKVVDVLCKQTLIHYWKKNCIVELCEQNILKCHEVL